MRMTAKLFGVVCAASLVFCAACDGIGNKAEDENDDKDKIEVGDDDDGKQDDTTVSYDLGSIVKFEGKDYLVVKNTETGSTVAEQSPVYHYYPNARADAYRDHLIEMYEVKAPYVLVFNTETTKSTTTNVTSWDDEYLILRNGAKHYRIRYRWENLIPTIATITANELRTGYDPSCFVIDMYSAAYGSDLSKKSYRTYRFNYNSDGKTIDYRDDNWRLTDNYIDFVYIDGKERNQYAIRNRISDHASSYILRNPNNTDTDNGNEFFEFRVDFEEDNITPKSYRLIANGDGTIEGGTNNKLYQATLRIYRLEYRPKDERLVSFTVTTKKNNDDATKTTLTFNDLYERTESDDDTSNQPGNGGTGADGNVDNPSEGDPASGTETYGESLTNEGVDKYVTVSEKTTIVNDIEVPDWITFSVPFEDADAPMSEFTKVTFVPQTKADYVIYVPKTGSETAYEFIDNFKAGYDIFGEYALKKPVSTSTPSTDSSVTLQDDAAAKADTSTKRFTFGGSPFRIELEEMTTSGFDITTDFAASGGKAGLLADEDSRAEAIITFPAGDYTGYAVIYAPSGDHDAFYVQFGDGHIRVYADDPPPSGYKPTSRTPIKLSCDKEVTVRMVISPRSEKFTSKAVETGMYIDYVEFTKD
ncbi:MAG: hypothetical protein K2J14_05735 [Treponemataceae bacterium]|nr:hypothetical protein [Treponemataceae bacterium]